MLSCYGMAMRRPVTTVQAAQLGNPGKLIKFGLLRCRKMLYETA
jgi:hypothetical protein